MKPLSILKVALLATTMTLAAACTTHRKVVKETPQPTDPVAVADSLKRRSFLQQVNSNAQTTHFITSKVKFTVAVGSRQMTLTGNLKMKRDDVIRLQLMAFGFVEAGRMEFTKEYVLIIDRINKQYLKVPYEQVDFLRNSNIDFYVLQGLFWNELFQPHVNQVGDEQLKAYTADIGSDDTVIAMEAGKLSYRWLADNGKARVKMANILFQDKFRGNYQLNWDYEDFQANGRKMFPMSHTVTFNTPDREISMEMILNYMGAEENWEPRTTVSTKYRQVQLDEILERFMSL